MFRSFLKLFAFFSFSVFIFSSCGGEDLTDNKTEKVSKVENKEDKNEESNKDKESEKNEDKNRDDIVNTTVEISCKVLKPFVENIKKNKEELEKLGDDEKEKKAKLNKELMGSMINMESEINKIINKYGFKTMKEFDELSMKYKEEKDNKMQEELKVKIKKECNFDIDEIEKSFGAPIPVSPGTKK